MVLKFGLSLTNVIYLLPVCMPDVLTTETNVESPLSFKKRNQKFGDTYLILWYN